MRKIPRIGKVHLMRLLGGRLMPGANKSEKIARSEKEKSGRLETGETAVYAPFFARVAHKSMFKFKQSTIRVRR